MYVYILSPGVTRSASKNPSEPLRARSSTAASAATYRYVSV